MLLLALLVTCATALEAALCFNSCFNVSGVSFCGGGGGTNVTATVGSCQRQTGQVFVTALSSFKSFSSWSVSSSSNQFVAAFFSDPNCTSTVLASSSIADENLCSKSADLDVLFDNGQHVYGGFLVGGVRPPGGGSNDHLPCLCAGYNSGPTASEFMVSTCSDCTAIYCNFWTPQGGSYATSCSSPPITWPDTLTLPALEVDSNQGKDCPCVLKSNSPVTVSLLSNKNTVQLNYTFISCGAQSGDKSVRVSVDKLGSQFILAPPYVMYLTIGGSELSWWTLNGAGPSSCLYTAGTFGLPWSTIYIIIGASAGAALVAGVVAFFIVRNCRKGRGSNGGQLYAPV